MLVFNPLSDSEIENLLNPPLLEKGVYPFLVHDAKEEISKRSGNPMLKLILHVAAAPKDMRVITDYLTGNEKMIYKIKHFCEAIGLQEAYARGILNPEQLKGRSGKCYIKIKKGQMKQDGSFFADQNEVADYVSPVKIADEFNDPINF